MTKSADGQLLRHSPLESARFGLRIYRGNINPADVVNLWDFIVDRKADVAIFRLPAEIISGMKGYLGPRDQLIHADTLVYYDCRLNRLNFGARTTADITFRRAIAQDSTLMETAVKQIFFRYQNHYHANPAFLPDDILAGYQEWAVSHLEPSRDTPSWVALDRDEIVGFICCSLDLESNVAEIILNGVLESHAGRGIYGDLLGIAQRHFAERGVRVIRVSTQVGNYRVQRVWSRHGFTLAEAFDTWHVNAMLTKTTDISGSIAG